MEFTVFLTAPFKLSIPQPHVTKDLNKSSILFNSNNFWLFYKNIYFKKNLVSVYKNVAEEIKNSYYSLI